MTESALRTLRSLPSGHVEGAATAPWRLAQRYCDVRAGTEALVAPLSAEDCALQSMPDASPAKWHLAHTTWFFETFVLESRVEGHRAFDPSYRVLFNSYYEGVGERHPRPERGMLSRPDLATVFAYRAHVDRAMISCIDAADADPALHALIELGLNHEQQHQELILTDLLHLLSRNPLRPAYAADAPPMQGRHDGAVQDRALRWLAPPAASCLSDTTDPALRSTTRCRRTVRTSRPSTSRRAR